jgi:hypothetical protein
VVAATWWYPTPDFDGLVLAVALRGLSFSGERGDGRVEAAAGEPWDNVVAGAVGVVWLVWKD